MSQIRQAKLKFLPVLTQQQAVIGNRCSQNSQSLDRAITRENQTHDVDVCGAGKAYNMVAKRVSNYEFSDEDINTIVTPTAPATIHTGPITRARARQLNYQVLSFLGNDSNVHENMMLPKLDTFVVGVQK